MFKQQMSGARLYGSQPVVLLLEDDQNDVFLFERALAQGKCECDLRAVSTVLGAKTYLENVAAQKNSGHFLRPCVIVSDFRLAGGTALEFIHWLRSDHRFADIPVIMLSAFSSKLDRTDFAELAVSAFLRKTGDILELARALVPALPWA